MLVHLAALVIFGGMFKLNNRPPTENIETPDPDFYRNVSELISSKGYPVENHVVQTEDGFLLSVQHIPHGRHDADKSGGGREVVFLQHGFLSASHTWVLNFPHQSLGFILADAGYDVWLGNTRGNAYSRTHVKYTPDQKEFWENSTFSDMGYYDIPAMVDYVLNATGQQQLSYVGHSQGTTACFAMLSERPEYNRKIKALIALAPVTTLAYMTNPLRYVAHYKTEIEILATLSGWRDFLPNYALVKLFSQFVCARREPGVCNDALSILFGESKQLNATRIHVYTSHTPSGSSMKSMFHYGQLYLSRRFEKYDYGWKGNLHHYGQSELISSKGYPVENHVVQTEDGFLLSVQRIPHGRHDAHKSGGGREAVFLQHGFLTASHDWVINFPHQSLGFILADAGYDVWLGNTRGNTYSRRHVKYTPDQKEFWENSTFSDMGYYDIPAMIDYVLNATGQQQLSYVGHSQGTTACFAMLSERPEYNRKIKAFIALAPISTLSYMTNPLRYVAYYKTEIELLFNKNEWRDFLPNFELIKLLSEFLCSREEPWICTEALAMFFGESKQLNSSRLHVYGAHTPSGTSVKSLLHYAQLYLSGRFEKFDYGREGNMEHYGQASPPEFDLSSVTAPIAVAWASEDNLADPEDVALLLKKLKSLVDTYKVPFQPFNHVDFTLGLQAKSLVYDKVLEWLKTIPRGRETRNALRRELVRPRILQMHQKQIDFPPFWR